LGLRELTNRSPSLSLPVLIESFECGTYWTRYVPSSDAEYGITVRIVAFICDENAGSAPAFL